MNEEKNNEPVCPDLSENTEMGTFPAPSAVERQKRIESSHEEALKHIAVLENRMCKLHDKLRSREEARVEAQSVAYCLAHAALHGFRPLPEWVNKAIYRWKPETVYYEREDLG